MARKIKDLKGEQIKHDGQDVYGSDVISVVKDVNIDKRILTITGTTEAKDRDGDVIKLKGWQLDNYLKNPVFLWSHDYRSVPLAAAQKVIRRRNPARMDFSLRFPTEGLYPFADMIFQLYGEKVINASSVGFIPFEWEPLEKDDHEDSDGEMLYRTGRRYLKQELLELSGCAVPSNPEALQNSVSSKGIIPELECFLEAGGCVPEPDNKEDIISELEEVKAKGVEVEEETGAMIQVPEQIEPKEEKSYTCECIECGHKMESTKHCKDIKCPECGGTMRRVERPGGGQADIEPDEEKAIGGSKTLPLDGGTAWDATAAEKRVRAWAGGDNIDWKKYRTAFVWYDSANPEKFGSYKLLFADVFGGTLKAKWGGVMRAMGAVLGARGGVNISDADRKAAYNFLAAYYKKFDKPVPSYHSFSEADVKFLEELFKDNEELKNLKAQVKELELKAGAVLNAKNKDRLTKAQTLIQEVLNDAGVGQESVSQVPGEEPEGQTKDFGTDLYEHILDAPGKAKKGSKPAQYDLSELVKGLTDLAKKVSAL